MAVQLPWQAHCELIGLPADELSSQWTKQPKFIKGFNQPPLPSISSIRKFLVQKKGSKKSSALRAGTKKKGHLTFIMVLYPFGYGYCCFFWPTFLVGSPYFDAFLLYRIHFMKGQKQKFSALRADRIFEKNFWLHMGGVVRTHPPPMF